jgi:hypothetical protein
MRAGVPATYMAYELERKSQHRMLCLIYPLFCLQSAHVLLPPLFAQPGIGK